jgi:hypothetical protein
VRQGPTTPLLDKVSVHSAALVTFRPLRRVRAKPVLLVPTRFPENQSALSVARDRIQLLQVRGVARLRWPVIT